MSSINLPLPIFILLCAFVYLFVVYGLLKIVEIQKQKENMMSDALDSERQMKLP